MLAVLLLPRASEAGIVASPHDLAAQGYTFSSEAMQKKSSVCNYCHVPHKAKGARIWATTPPSLQEWGTVGPLCYSCHDGVAIVSPNVDASNTAFNPKSHGLKIENLPAGDDVSESGLPYTGDSEVRNIECSTCHNPHDNSNRPFIRAPITELCQKCHQRRENSGYNLENAESTHPVHKEAADEVEGDSPISVQDDFKVGFPQAYPSEDGKDTEGVHWTLGGHFSEGGTGTMECVTCHSVHGKESIGPKGEKLLSIDPVLKFSNEFCEGCHRGKRGDDVAEPPYPNPGGTVLPRTYHPVDNDVSNGAGRIVELKEPEGWVFGESGEVLCTTCHKAHDALKNSPILRPPVQAETFCEECHSSESFNHHPIGNDLGGGSVDSGKPHASTREVTISAGFLSKGTTYGKTEEGALYCSSCHRAHNAKCEPILVTDCSDGGSSCDICLECHPKFNPTWQTDDSYKATHFIGNPYLNEVDQIDLDTGQVIGKQPGYGDQYPPLNFETWPESGLESVYGGTGGAASGQDGGIDIEITCCSCHSFDSGGITAGDADEAPYDGTTLASGYVESDLTSGLLARAGQFKEWLESDVEEFDIGGNRGTVSKVDKYLCTGCHGLTPNSHPDSDYGEGFSHPMMNADGSNLTPADGVRLTYNQHLNCESCHSAHEADSKGGFFILRETDQSPVARDAGTSAPNPYLIRDRSEIEFAPLCHRCHIDY